MKKLSRIGLVLLFSAGTITAFGYFFLCRTRFIPPKKDGSFIPAKNAGKALKARLRTYAASLKTYAKANRFNEQIGFLVDMNISSGKNRFFVYNLDRDSLEMDGLVTHGSGNGNEGNGISFSNIPGSLCTSLGKYKIGHSYTGRFGLAYKLYGLDPSNNKAFERAVVLHSLDCVPAGETDPFPICESLGCPTVAPSFLQSLKRYIDPSGKPILLWIYH